ncbi:hypothetical protein HMI54_011343, partial [Coelomomyces lativittatus]
SVIDTIKTENLRKKFLLELEVSKYVLEFYVYASVHNKAGLLELIEDDAELRAGYLYKLVLNDVYQKLLQSNLLFFKKEYIEAASTIKPALDDQPNNIEVLLLYGVAGYYAGNYKEVIPVFEKVLSKGIKEVQVLACLGDAYFNTKNLDKAIETYEELLTLQSNIPAVVNIGRSYQLKQNPDYVKALEYYLKANELEPDNYTTLLLTGDAYINQTPQDFAKAFEFYEQAYRINNSNIDLVRMLTNCTIKLPEIEFEKSFEIYTKHIELEPNNALPYMAMGDRFFNKEDRDFSSAYDYYEKAFELADTNLVLIKTMSECLQNLPASPFEKSQKLYLKWIELEPGNGNYTDAKSYFEKCLPSGIDAHIVNQNLGHIALIQQDETAAKALYRKSYDLFSDKDEFFNSSLSDLVHLEKGGINKETLEKVMKEVMSHKE